MTQEIKILGSTSNTPSSLGYRQPAVSFTGGRVKFYIGDNLDDPQEVTSPSNIIGITPSTSNAHQVVTVKEDGSGFEAANSIPSLTTTERNALTNIPTDLIIYNETAESLQKYSGSVWVDIVSSGGSGSLIINEVPSGTVNGVNTTFTLSNDASSSVMLFLAYGGTCVAVDPSAFTVTDDTIEMDEAPVTGTILLASYGTGGVVTTPNVTFNGDVSGSGTSLITLTLEDSVVSNAKLADMANRTFKGNVSGSTGAVDDLTPEEVQTALNNNFGTITTSFTIGSSDVNKNLKYSGGTGITITLPKDSTTDLPDGSQINIWQLGAGQITLAPEDGTVLLNGTSQSLYMSTSAATKSIVIIKDSDSNSYLVAGPLNTSA